MGQRCSLDEDVAWEEYVGRRCDLEGVSGMKMWLGRSGWDDGVVWEERVGQRCG